MASWAFWLPPDPDPWPDKTAQYSQLRERWGKSAPLLRERWGREGMELSFAVIDYWTAGSNRMTTDLEVGVPLISAVESSGTRTLVSG